MHARLDADDDAASAGQGFRITRCARRTMRNLTVLRLIQSLNPIVPHYGIDLTRKLPTPASGKTEGRK